MSGLKQQTEEHEEDEVAASIAEATSPSPAEPQTVSSERHRDAARTRVFLARALNQLRGREAAHQHGRAPVSAAEVHADCALLLSVDGECESLRAACATTAILAAADATEGGEQRQRWRRVVSETGGLWQEYCRTVSRLCCRIESAFLRMAGQFAARVDSPGGWDDSGEIATEARQLWLLADTMAGLEGRVGAALSPEFEACRDCLRHFLALQQTETASTEPLRQREAAVVSIGIDATPEPRPPRWLAALVVCVAAIALVLGNLEVAAIVTTSATGLVARPPKRTWMAALIVGTAVVALLVGNLQMAVVMTTVATTLTARPPRRALVTAVAISVAVWALKAAGRFLLRRHSCWSWDRLLEDYAAPNGVPF